ncbi:Clp protease N-terminal domain-containing protein, partial [Streptomyces sp. Agncl-13]|uniref:Clp protease N-terminal domain-containing protein n=1 Tax=Streptomyces sp. Agncl-13 TaxID=3400628 RepID=UPI003A86778B
GTEHLLLGLLTDGVAAATLEELGVTRDKIREVSRRLFAYPAEYVFDGLKVPQLVPAVRQSRALFTMVGET